MLKTIVSLPLWVELRKLFFFIVLGERKTHFPLSPYLRIEKFPTEIFLEEEKIILGGGYTFPS